jgi:hypothetical protein
MKMTFKDIVKEQIPPQVIITIIFVAMLAGLYGVWSEETTGEIVLSAPVYGTAVIVDGKLAGESKSANEQMLYKYPAGVHTVIVSRGDFWPWTRDVILKAKETKTLHPFLVRKETKPAQIAPSVYDGNAISKNPEYAEALALIGDARIKEDIAPLLNETGIKNARAADYFPGRTDVLIVAVTDGIFAVETGTNTPRNFQPIYKGTEPTFVKTDNDVLIVKDGTSIYRIAGYDK